MRTSTFTALLLSIFLLLSVFTKAQLVVTEPPFPTENDEVNIIFDATQGSAGLAGYTGDVYAHIGVITNESAGNTDWKYVKTEWGQNTPETLLEKIDTDLYKLVITPSVREYFEIPDGETVEQIAMVFRSAEPVGESYLEGKTTEGNDILVEMFQGGLNVSIISPYESSILLELNDELEIIIQANSADSIFLFIDNQLVKKDEGNNLSYDFIANSYGEVMLVASAKNNSQELSDTATCFVRPEPTVEIFPSGLEDGINYIDETTVVLAFYAPAKEYAFAIGDFNNWSPNEDSYMKKTPDGNRFWIEIENLEPNKEYAYQYFIDGNLKIGDPYCEKILDPWNDRWIPETSYPNLLPYPEGKTTGIVSVLQTAQTEYPWQVEDFEAPYASDLVIYELLIRDFTEERTFQSLIDTLEYLDRLGVNAIELMPVIEFDGNESWGYGPSYFFAVDKYYGPAETLKAFIDECHKKDISVIMDIVLNHATGNSPLAQLYWNSETGQTTEENPWFNVVSPHPFSVFHDFNHDSELTRSFMKRVLQFWIDEYKFDGYRYDLSKGFTQKYTGDDIGAWSEYDQGRIDNIERLTNWVLDANPKAYNILEHFADNDEETVLANAGIMLWGVMCEQYGDATMGWDSNLSWGYYGNRGWSQPNLVTFMESHDEERLQFKNEEWGNCENSDYCVKDTTIGLSRLETASALFLTFPGPKMIWQFGEQGYDYSINWPTMTEESRTANKPPKWDYMEIPARKKVFNTYSRLINMRKENDIFRSPYTTVNMDVGGTGKRIILSNTGLPANEVQHAIAMGNFDVNGFNMQPGFNHTGTWFEFYTGQAINVTTTTDEVFLAPGDFKIFTNIAVEPWCNLQWPYEITATPCEIIQVYGQIRVPSVTNQVGPAAEVEAWVGFSPNNSNPAGSDWTWVDASFYGDRSATGETTGEIINDEYVASLPSLATGTWHYTFRYRINGKFIYGGCQPDGGYSGGGIWNGDSFISGTLTVEDITTKKWFVSVDGSNSNSGNASSPFATIQHAINQSTTCDTIIVAQGTYLENIDFDGHNVLVASEYLNSNDENIISQTVIDGGENGSVAKFINNENNGAHLYGFTLKNGLTSGEFPYNSGAGVQIIEASASLSHLIITDNSSVDCGGGIFCNQGSAIIKNTIIKNNNSGCATGLGVNASSVILEESEIINNIGSWGKAISAWETATLIISKSKIIGNSSSETDENPLIQIGENSTLLADNILVVDNISNKLLTIEGAINIESSTIANNSGFGGTENPATLFNSGSAENTIIRDSEINFSYSFYPDYCNMSADLGGTNINTDPILSNPSGGDYSLGNGSPCIDAGNPNFAFSNDLTDIDGFLRVWDGNGDGSVIIDMGAYEFGAPKLIFIGNDTTLCENEELVLDAGNGYTSYNWNDGLAYTQELNVSESGEYFVEVGLPEGGFGFGTISVIFEPTPIVQLSPTYTICEGSEITLNAGDDFLGYLWSNGSQEQFQTFSEAGEIWVEIENYSECWSERFTINIAFESLPIVELGVDTTICNDISITLDAGEGASYLWNTGATTRTISTPIDTTFISTISYSVEVTSENGCVGEGFREITFKYCTGIEELTSIIEAEIQPNPSRGDFALILNSSEKMELQIEIISTKGEVIKRIENLEIIGKNRLPFNLQNHNSGLYFMRVISKKGVLIKKIVLTQ